VKLAIIGCGMIGAKRAAAANGHQIVAVCDIDAGRRDKLAAGTGARAVGDWRDALALDVDAVVVATPHDSLAAAAIAAIESGRHVLVEKPGGRSAAEVRGIAEAARRKGVVAKVGFNHRFHPAMLRAKTLVEQGAIGPLLFVRGRYGHGGRPGYEKEWRFRREVSGGGELIDQGSHLIDLSRWFLGDLALAFGAVPTYFWPGEVDDNCFLALTNAAGRIAWLHASWTEWKNQFSFEIMGRTGKLTIDGLGGSYGVERLTYHRMLPEMGPPDTTMWEFPFPDRSFADEVDHFAEAVAQGRSDIADIDDAVATLEIVHSIYQRAKP
jgi:predicted dehydrogenase